MVKFIATCMISIFGMIYGFALGAWNIERTNRFDQWIEESIQWVDQNSHYDMDGIKTRPIIVLADKETLQYIWNMRNGSKSKKVGAFYSVETHGSKEEGNERIIHKLYLPINFRPSRVYDGKSGIHEVVHFAQMVTGARDGFECKEEGERSAYNLAAIWMVQHGVSDEKWIAKYVAQGESESQCK